MKPHIEILDKLKEHIHKILSENYKSLKNCKYLDLRLGISEFKSVSSENGHVKDVNDDSNLSLGIRVIAGEMASWGFYGQSLGKNDLKSREIKRLLLQVSILLMKGPYLMQRKSLNLREWLIH